MQNAIDVKRAAASKLRDLGHKLPTSVKLQTILGLIEAQTEWPIPEDTFTYMLRFIDSRPVEAAALRDINYMERQPLRLGRQMQMAAERAGYQPKIGPMGSSVREYKQLDHLGF